MMSDGYTPSPKSLPASLEELARTRSTFKDSHTRRIVRCVECESPIVGLAPDERPLKGHSTIVRGGEVVGACAKGVVDARLLDVAVRDEPGVSGDDYPEGGADFDWDENLAKPRYQPPPRDDAYRVDKRSTSDADSSNGRTNGRSGSSEPPLG